MPATYLYDKCLYATLVASDITSADIVDVVRLVKLQARFIKGVIVAPCHVRLASRELRGHGIDVIAPIAYPLGHLPSDLKHAQARQCIKDGADGIAAVMQIEALRSGNIAIACADAEQVTSAARQVGLIANAACLSTQQNITAGSIALQLRAAYVTNAGFGMETETSHISTVRAECGRDLCIVAAGGIHSTHQVIECLHAGANAAATRHALEIARQLASITISQSQGR